MRWYIHFTTILSCFSSAFEHRDAVDCFAVAVAANSVVTFTRSFNSVVVTVKVVIGDSGHLLEPTENNYLVTTTWLNSVASFGTVVTVVDSE